MSVETETTETTPTFKEFYSKGTISKFTWDFIQDQKFEKLTPVQAATIPVMMKNTDVLVEACTGSGKTLAFLIPLMERLSKDVKLKKDYNKNRMEVHSIIIAPTRELLAQIIGELNAYLKFFPDTQVRSFLLLGGKDGKTDEERALKLIKRQQKANFWFILCSTPGRLSSMLDQTNHQVLCFKDLSHVILDEADRLLNASFTTQISNIFSCIPKQRRTCLFSATLTSQTETFVRAGLRNPKLIKVSSTESVTRKSHHLPTNLENTIISVANPYCKLYWLLCKLVEWAKDSSAKPTESKKLLVFFLTCSDVDYYVLLVKKLFGLGSSDENFSESTISEIFPQESLIKLRSVRLHLKRFFIGIHGKMDQKLRRKSLNKIRSEDLGSAIIFASDVMARGIDLEDLEEIVQFDPPQTPDLFVHRAGRTARAGKSGKASLILLPSEEDYKEFLINREIKLSCHTPQITNNSALASLRKEISNLVQTNEVFCKIAKKAFVAHMRGYIQHDLKYLLSVQHLDFDILALSMGLKTAPRMVELEHVRSLRKRIAAKSEEIEDPKRVKM